MKMTGRYTTHGAQLAARALAEGKTLTVTRAAAGSGLTAADSLLLTAEAQDAAIHGMTAQEGSVTVTAVLNAVQAERRYTLREVGLYARLEGEDEVLYRLFTLDEEVTVEPDTDLVLTFYLTETVLTEEQLAVNITQQGLVTQAVCSVTVQQAVATHAADAQAHAALLAQKAPAEHGHSAAHITGGTLGGPVYAQSGTDYTLPLVRGIVLSTESPSGGENGQLWIQYTA
ncbi:MAG: hypothetical protein IKU58_06215 [Clostridia bacterium]|nr:hypothetical protein [Clostridia bacterium]